MVVTVAAFAAASERATDNLYRFLSSAHRTYNAWLSYALCHPQEVSTKYVIKNQLGASSGRIVFTARMFQTSGGYVVRVM